MSYGDEDAPGGSYGGDYTLSEGQCADKCVCNALDAGLAAIVIALQSIDSTLEKLVQDDCKVVDKCKDKILEMIDEHYNTGAKTCDECKSMIEQGLGGTIEFAVACAGACIDEIPKNEPCLSGVDDGKTCTGCGQEPCCCVDGTCLPCEDQQPKKKYVGWCDAETKLAFALPQGVASDSLTAVAVAQADTEEVALQEAEKYCDSYKPIEPPPEQPQPLTPTNLIGTFCDITTFYSQKSVLSVTSLGQTAFGLAGLAESFSQIGNLEAFGMRAGDVSSAIAGYYQASAGAPPVAAALFLPSMAAALGCTDPSWVKALEIIASMGIVEKFTGVDLSDFATSLHYVANAACRRKFVDPEHAAAAYLANAMDSTQLDAHFAIDGLCPAAVGQRLETLRAKPSPDELVRMVHKGIIEQAEFRTSMREAGFIRPNEIEDVYDSRFHDAELNTVIRMRQNATDDDAAAQRLGLDDGSSGLSAGLFAKWLKGNGITAEETQQAWRNHWQNPSVGNLVEFLHRLRDNDDFGGESKLMQEYSDSLTTLGITPYWHKHYLATAFTPLLKRDIRGAYESGAISDDDLPKALRSTGHDDNACTVLAKEYKQGRRKHVITHIALHNWTHQQIDGEECKDQLTQDGYSVDVATQAMQDFEYNFASSSWADCFVKSLMNRQQFTEYLTAWGVTQTGAERLADKLSFKVGDHTVTRGYIAGTIDRATAASKMSTDGVAEPIISTLLDDSDTAVENSFTLECIRGIKHRYAVGEITESEARNELLSRDIGIDRANELVSAFECERSALGKQLPVEKLCHWLYIGAISQPDFVDRLLRLGYTEANAALLLYDCVQSNTLRAIKEAKTLSKELQSESDKVLRATEKAIAATGRQNAKMETLRKQKAKLRATRDTQLLTSASRIEKATGVTLPDAMESARAILQQGQEQYGLGIDETLKVLILASESLKGKTIDELQPIAVELMQSAANSGLEPDDELLGSAPSANGSTQPSG